MGTNKDYVIKQIGTYWSHDSLSLYKIWTCLVELFLSYSRNNPTSTNIWKVLSLTVCTSSSNGLHTSCSLMMHSTIFGFIQVRWHEFGQSWGAHVFLMAWSNIFLMLSMSYLMTKWFSSIISIFLCYFEYWTKYLLAVFPDFIACTIKFHSNNMISWVA